jgi:acetylornithine/N-succinyldiaminopimelate aminotransferase
MLEKNKEHQVHSSILPVYNRSNVSIDRGEGVYLISKEGDKYLDFVSGVAVNCLGHCHPKMIEALTAQSNKLWHISNLFQIPGMQEFADLLTTNSFADTVFFCNSGAEAIECCIKMVRKYHDATGNPDRYRIITFEGAFHGRTLAAIWASKRDQLMQEGFGPPVEGFDHIPFADIEAVKAAITEETGAILVEPIQGDGGIRSADNSYFQQLRELCDEHGLLLCFDEIQSGMGRTGSLFAHELTGVTPDVVTSAKGIGGGFPLGACLATEKAASGMTLGTHGSTYGGNPLAMAVGNVVVNELLKPSFLENVSKMGELLKQTLEDLQNQYPNIIRDVRGKGLLLGIQTGPSNKEVIKSLEQNFLLAPAAGENVVRLLPPLIIEETHIEQAREAIKKTCEDLS